MAPASDLQPDAAAMSSPTEPESSNAANTLSNHSNSDESPQDTVAMSDEDTADDKKSLLDLTPEIRNNIYQNLIDISSPAHLPRKWGAKLHIRSPMLLINKQISHEYATLAAATSPVVEAQVRDFNFNHVAAYLNRLSELDAEELVNKDLLPAERVIHIKILVTKSDQSCHTHNRPQNSPVCRWLNRMRNPKLLTSAEMVEYELEKASKEPDLRELGAQVIYLRMKGRERAVEEWEKIKGALKRGLKERVVLDEE